MARVAMVVGATGIIGGALAQELVREGWPVLGLARRPSSENPGVSPIAANLLDPSALFSALKGHEPTHVFLTSSMRNDTEAENIRVNSAMVRKGLSRCRVKSRRFQMNVASGSNARGGAMRRRP